LLQRHTTEVNERFKALRDAVDTLEALEREHPVQSLFANIGSIRYWYRAANIFGKVKQT